MKVIFCDVDGVLNNESTSELTPNGYRGVSDKLIRNLRKIVDETGAKIVLSSDWRLLKDTPVNGKDYDYLVESLDKVSGLTLFDHTADISWSQRGAEIRKYLKDHPSITDFAVLDDILFLGFTDEDLIEHIVLTDAEEGLSDEDVLRAVKILQGDK